MSCMTQRDLKEWPNLSNVNFANQREFDIQMFGTNLGLTRSICSENYRYYVVSEVLAGQFENIKRYDHYQ